MILNFSGTNLLCNEARTILKLALLKIEAALHNTERLRFELRIEHIAMRIEEFNKRLLITCSS